MDSLTAEDEHKFRALMADQLQPVTEYHGVSHIPTIRETIERITRNLRLEYRVRDLWYHHDQLILTWYLYLAEIYRPNPNEEPYTPSPDAYEVLDGFDLKAILAMYIIG